MKKPGKRRLDELLVERGLAESRAQAQGLIIGGKVRTGTVILDKAGKAFAEDIALEVEQPPPYVGRGGEKLAGFLEEFPLNVTDARILDVGASTGGFTDCLLQRGAAHVTCVDVGHGQLHFRLREDPRVANFERVNARALDEVTLPHTDYDLVVMDLSFISLRRILGPAWRRVCAGGCLVALVKPQFEAGKAEADAGRGVIRDPAVIERVRTEIRAFAADNLPGAVFWGECASPIRGADGNQEYLMGWKKIAENPPAALHGIST
jgi:23S rRNA (cytidine1920-2'-O)/16S rRNA (cytidine1409-2'-O)-methyltransferase